MLEDSLFESEGAKKTRKPVTVVVAAVAHAVAIGVLILIPLLQTQALTLPPINLSLLAPRMEMRAVDVTLVHSARPHIQKQLTPPPGVLTAPEAIPPRVVIETDPTPPNLGFFLPSNGTGRSIVSGLLARESDDLALGPPPAPVSASLPPPPPIEKVSPVRRGGEVHAANLIHQVNPVYPQLARQTHVQGVVVLEAVINKEGDIESLRVLSGHPLLIQAALDAVKQWKYRPTMLNNEPVEVVTTVTVTFTLR